MKIFARAFFFVLIFSLSTASGDTLWRQYGFNAAHTSYNTSETILNTSNVSNLTLLWKSNAPKTGAFVTNPVLGFDAHFCGF